MSVQKKKMQFDYDSPEVRAIVDDAVHGTFMKEGTMVAFPTGFPGASVPIVPDESRITALDATPDGMIYGGTGGKRAHIFVGMFHGVTGMVFDMKAVDGATQCPAVCCGKKKLLACVNGSGGGRILTTGLQPLPFDLIQEWGFERPAFEDLGQPAAGEPILHAVADMSREKVVGITSRHVFTVDMDTPKPQIVGEVAGAGRLGVGSKGGVFGLDGATHVWRYDTSAKSLSRRAVALPDGAWGTAPLVWARHQGSGLLYTADGDGRLFSFDEERGFSSLIGRTPLAPVSAMAVTFDGRVFGFCGPELARMFCYDPRRGAVADLGVAASVIERRRYGYVFGDAVTGRDGEIIFGEDDDFGHVWLYFPKIVPA